MNNKVQRRMKGSPPCQHDQCWKPWYDTMFVIINGEVQLNKWQKWISFVCLEEE